MQPACTFTGVTRVSNPCCACTGPICKLDDLRTWLFAILVSCLVLAGLTGCGFRANGSVAGVLLVQPSTVAFGTVPVGQTATSKVSLLNETSGPIAIAQLSIAGQSFSLINQSSSPINIGAGDTYSFDIGFMPQQASRYSGQFTATNAAGNPIAQAPITGVGIGGSVSTPTLTISPANLAFGNVTMNTALTLPVTLTSTGTGPVTISSAALSGTGFTVSGATFPVTLNPTQSVTLSVQFDPTAAGAVTGQLTIQSTSSTNGTAVVSLTGTGTAVAATLSALSCSNASMTGAGSDACTVTLSGPAGSGGLSVSVASSNGAVTVPATVVVPANASSAGFTATVSAVSTGQAVTLTASAGSVTRSFALQLNAAVPALTISPASLAFGNVTVNTASTLPVTLTSTGTAPVTINSAGLSGTGFTVSGATFPVTLNPSLAITLDVQFDPATVGAVTGQLTIQSNSSTNGTMVISLTGTGESVSHYVDLSWQAPGSSADPVAGYHIYRSTGSSPYQLVNSSLDTQTTYVDNNVQSGQSYDYIVKSVDSSGVESTPSNQAAATIP